ncbi:MAG: RNA 2',3'-cyclic phosphodiesterase [Bacteroidetes bacterium QS_3_64_15]|nr:MAG: RNA 2',3'-cyclic phosphodiesterase [Bacteroidetes bacterium QS_3_64_15]
MRLFTAIDIPDSLRNDLAALQGADASAVRWSDPEQFHVTLRFIGDVSEEPSRRLSGYEELLGEVDVAPVRCRPYGLDVLPSRRSPRVLMLGLERTDSMMALYNAVSDALEAEGLAPEDRTYRPHVTIARLDDADRDAVHDFLCAHSNQSFPTFEAEQFVLYESTRTPDGAIHKPLASYPLRP